MRLHVETWRWEGVLWYLRAGKCLTETLTEVLIQLKPPPQRVFADSALGTGYALPTSPGWLRSRLSRWRPA